MSPIHNQNLSKLVKFGKKILICYRGIVRSQTNVPKDVETAICEDFNRWGKDEDCPKPQFGTLGANVSFLKYSLKFYLLHWC